jgi:putative membrane protein
MFDWHAGGHMTGMWFWWLLAIGLIGVIAWAVVRSASRTGNGASESPQEILKRRYARGEIDKDEYEKRLQDLRH